MEQVPEQLYRSASFSTWLQLAGMTHRRWAYLVLPLVLSALAVPGASADSPGFITGSGTQLLLNGQPFRFTGLNIYNANSDGWCWDAMRSGPALDQALTAIGPGKSVMRAWFFQPLAIDKGTGLRDWSGFDHTLQVAAAHGVKVIATLTDQWGECGTNVAGNGFKTDQWYIDGYKQTQPGMLVPYRDWVAEVVARYKDNPAVAFWQLINEAEVADYTQDPACQPGDGPAVILRNWAQDVGGLVKSIDPNHLVSLGTIGSGQCGAQGDQYQYVHDIPEIDLCEFHDYGAPLVGIPGDQWNGLQVRLNQCAALNKPLFVGEAGIIPNDVGGTLQGRANAFRAKIGAQCAAGVQGFMAWAWHDPSTLADYDIGPGDPALAALIPCVQQTYRLTDLGTLGAGTLSKGNAISPSGKVTGLSYTNNYQAQHAFLWDDTGMHDLGTLSGGTYSEGLAVNDFGEVAGYSLLNNAAFPNAFLWDGSTLQYLTLGGSYSNGWAINAFGQVTGNSYTDNDAELHAFLWNGASMQDLGTLPGGSGYTYSQGRAINDLGQVTGESGTGDGPIHPFLWDDTGMHDLGPDLITGQGNAINNKNPPQVTGVAYPLPGNSNAHAFLWDSTQIPQMRDLGTVGGTYSNGLAINDSGWVTGISLTANDAEQHAFLWDSAHGMRDLDMPGRPYSEGLAINAAGLVTGTAYAAGWASKFAFVSDGGLMQNLNTLIDPTDPLKLFVTLTDATDINDLGQIVANGKDTREIEQHAYLLSPVTTPVDTTPPLIQSNVTGTLGNLGWYVSNVQVGWTVNDDDSAISSSTGCGSTSVTTDTAELTFTCSATSAGGTSTRSVTIKRDATAPSATASPGPPANQYGWRNKNVTVTFSGTDAMSGGVTCDPQVVLSGNGTGQSASGYCYDAAGQQSNLATASGINIDKTNPTATIITPTDGVTYKRNQAVKASYSCSDTLSGILTCTGTIANGQRIETSKAVKNAKFTVTATDRAGNTKKVTSTYSVK
jgi:probable HAF family extracellular repeat protein